VQEDKAAEETPKPAEGIPDALVAPAEDQV
jgi:hypothetical protein